MVVVKVMRHLVWRFGSPNQVPHDLNHNYYTGHVFHNAQSCRVEPHIEYAYKVLFGSSNPTTLSLYMFLSNMQLSGDGSISYSPSGLSRYSGRIAQTTGRL